MNISDITRSVRRGSPGDELIVFLHGFTSVPAHYQPVVDAIREAKPQADILAPQMPYGNGLSGLLCTEKAVSLVADMLRAIDQLSGERPAPYRSIIFVGHSFGAVLSRRIAIAAHGERPGAPFEDELKPFVEARKWAPQIERIVLLAGMNRGWSVSSAMDWLTTAKWAVGSLVLEFFSGGRQTIFSLRQGAPFLIQTRLQWLALMRPSDGGAEGGAATPQFPIVQLLGSSDDQVSPDDNVDFAIDVAADGENRSFFYLEVPQTDHPSIIDMGAAANKPRRKTTAADEESRRRATRRERFAFALTASRDKIAADAVPRENLADSLPPKPNEDVSDVVFVIHGIRDKGFWTQKIAGAIKRAAASVAPAPDGAKTVVETDGGRVRSFTGSYGYFAMAPFMFPPIRRRKVEWLMDRYAEIRARYPKADISYVGHSNGTYLLIDALRRYPSARFKHVVFAGSVVRSDFMWPDYLAADASADLKAAAGRVQKVLNYVATNDWVVALLPRAVQPLRYFDLGGAGFDGFDEARKPQWRQQLKQVEYVKGEHGAGIKESQWDEIAAFIVDGTMPARENPDYQDAQNKVLKFWSARSPVLFWVVIAAVLGLGLWLLIWTLLVIGPWDLIPALLLLGYFLLIKTVITRF